MSTPLRIACVLAIIALVAAWGLLRSQNDHLENGQGKAAALGETP